MRPSARPGIARRPAAALLASALSLALVACGAAGCRRRRPPPEEQIRRALAEAEAAAGEKDLSRLKRFVSAQYRDAEQNDRAAVLGILQLQFLRYPTIHLFTKVAAVDVISPREGRATLFAAMASVPIRAPDELPRLAADLYRFDLDMRDEEGDGAWVVVGGTYRPADLSALTAPLAP
jgi:hypothetical protein